MDSLKFSIFDIFAYTIPGGISLLAAGILIDSSIVRLLDIGNIFQNMNLIVGLVAIVAAYVIGFAIDTPGSWLYYSIGCKIWGPPYEKVESDLSNSQKRALVRQYSPENTTTLQIWKVMKTMSHNLSMAAVILVVVSVVKIFQVSAITRFEWIGFSTVTFLMGCIFLSRAHIFDTWHYNDLSNTVKILQLKERALKDAEASPSNPEISEGSASMPNN